MKYVFLKGFSCFLILSLMLNSAIMLLSDISAEKLTFDYLHIIPMFVFNEILETLVAPSFYDGLFLIPVALVDGFIGGIIGFAAGIYLKRRDKAIFFIGVMLISFLTFQGIIYYLIPPLHF